jgi:hypothetical protein
MMEYLIYGVLAGIFTVCPGIAIYNLVRCDGYIASLHSEHRRELKRKG